MTLQIVAVLWLGAFIGAIAAGGAGFAFALAASSIWLHALSPVHTTMLVVTCGTLLHVSLVWPMRRSIELTRFAPFALGALLGVPIGVLLLTQTDVSLVRTTLGVFLIVYGLYATLAPRLPIVTGGGRGADALVGILGGVLGGLGGFSGVLPSIWTQLRGWSKDRARGVFQPFILLAHALTFCLLGTVALDSYGLVLVALALPPLFAGAWLGWHAYGRLNEGLFRRVLAILLLLSGVALLA